MTTKTFSLNFKIDLTESLNVSMRMNKYQRNRYYNAIYNHVFFLTLNKKPQAPLKKAKLMLIRYAPRTLDFDNCVSSFKPIVDGLVRSQILENDTWKITGPWIIDQQKIDKKEVPSVHVYVEEKK